MNEKDHIQDEIHECLKILDDNIEILTNLEKGLDDEKEDEFIPSLQLHDLYDMTEDMAESTKIKNAESSFLRRQQDENSANL